MRDRGDIMKDFRTRDDEKSVVPMIDRLDLILEVLLDLRDIAQRAEERIP